MSKELKEENVEGTVDGNYIMDEPVNEPVNEIIDEWGTIETYDSSWGEVTVNLDIGEKYMILLKEKEKNITFIGQVSGINPDDGIALFIDELDPENILQFNTEGLTLLFKTDDYEIIDIQKVKIFNIENLSGDDKELKKRLTKEVIDEIEIDIYELEKEERIYSKQECKESLLSDLINSCDNKISQEKLLDSINIILKLVYDKKETEDRIIPDWLVPIIDNERDTGSLQFTMDDYQELYDSDKSLGNRMYSDIMRDILNSYDLFKESTSDVGVVLKQHENKFYLDCIQDNSCLGIQGPYSFDERKNNKIFKRIIDYDENDNPIYSKLRDPEHIHAKGLLYIPDGLFSFIYNIKPYGKELTLYEKCLYGSLANHNNLLKRNIYQKLPILSKVINENDMITEKASKTLILYILNKKYDDNEDFYKLIKNLTPSLKEIYDSLDNEIKDKILNYNDVCKICLKYNIRIDELSGEDTKFINEIITRNTKSYSGKSKNIKYRKSKIEEKKISLDVRIRLAKELIFSMLNIRKRNEYIGKFIGLFCKEPEGNQEKQWYYNIYDNEKILCKHYNYISNNINTDKFIQMKQLYGMPPRDGNVYCKVCGEYICNEEFSLYEGFSEDKPISSKFESLQEEEDPFSKYDDKYEETILLVKNLGLGMGVSLEEKDIVLIIDMYDRMNEDLLANKRYQMTNVSNTDEHPRVKEILKKYKKDKDTKYKTEKTKDFQKFLKNTNKIIGYTSLILIIIQTGIPAYKLFRNLEFNLYDFSKLNDLSNFDSIPINNKTIDYTIFALKKCSKKYIDTDTKINWKYFDQLLSEEKVYDITNIRDQIINILRYCLSSDFPLLQNRTKEYYKYYQSIVNKFTKYEWELYKPLTKNSFINDINQIIDGNINKELLLTHYNSILIQNISLLREINREDISDFLKITPSDMMIQESFKRLFKITVSLYGKTSKPNFLIDSNILYFIQNSDKRIEEIFIKNGWNKTTNTMGPVSIKNLRTKIIPQIIHYYSGVKNDLNPCFSEEDNCNTYIHLNVNNYDLQLLNVFPKRIYTYHTPIVFPEGNYEEISEKIKEKLFRIYCRDPSGDFIKRTFNTNYLYSQILDISPELEIEFSDIIDTYENNIKETENNFFNIISSLHSKGILKLNKYFKPEKILLDDLLNYKNIKNTEIRLLKVFSNNDYNNENLYNYINDYLASFRNKDSSHNEQLWSTVFKEIYSDFNNQINDDLDKLSELLNENLNEYKDYRKRFENIFTKSDSDINLEREDRDRLEGIQEEGVRGFKYKKMNENDIKKLLLLMTDDKKFTNLVLDKYTYHIKYIISLLKNNCTKNTRVPSNWGLQQVNKDYINDYLSNKSFRSHGDLLKNKVRYNGFYSYYDSFEINDKLFRVLFDYCSDIWNDLDLLKNSVNSIISDNMIKILSKGIFIKLLLKLAEIGSMCRDNDPNIMSEIGDINDVEEISEIYDKFFCDIVIDTFECFYDTKWTESNTKDILSQRLAKQYEREKQNLISNLDKMSDDERHASTELQKMGITNWFKNSDKEHMKHIQSENYDNETLSERYESINEILNQNKVELDAMNYGTTTDTLLTVHLPGISSINGGLSVEEEGYGINDFNENNDEEEYEFDDNVVENSFNE